MVFQLGLASVWLCCATGALLALRKRQDPTAGTRPTMVKGQLAGVRGRTEVLLRLAPRRSGTVPLQKVAVHPQAFARFGFAR